jgi:predicted transcriptional regulator
MPLGPTKTRLEQFRVREKLSARPWAGESGIYRAQFRRYLSGTAEPMLPRVSRIVEAARTLTGRNVAASDLFDLGEDQAVNTLNPAPFRKPTPTKRILYDTRLDQLLVRLGIQPAMLARTSRLPRQTIGRLRAARMTPTVGMVATLVRALRKMGRDVQATDLFEF